MQKWVFGLLAGMGILGSSITASATGTAGIYVLSAGFGKVGGHRLMDITSRLQDLCGPQGNICDVWCSQSSFGGRDLGRHAVCRVIYRCPDGDTRSAEAEREEPILMRCLTGEAEDRQANAAVR